MREISQASYNRLQTTLETLREDIVRIEKELEIALGFGDISENTEYEAARASMDSKLQEIHRIEEILENCKIKQGYSNTISPGTLITVKILDNDGGVKEDLGLLMFDEVGDLLFDGRINPTSAIGKAIQGGISGIYTIQDITGNIVRCEVTVEAEDRLEEFFEKYPGKEAILSKMFS